MTIIPRPQTQPNRPYEDHLPEGATVVGWNEKWVVWKPQQHPFPGRTYIAHPVERGGLGSGHFDLTASEATELTGIPL